jgi:uncharacterized protein (TIGR00369 family)
MSELIRFCSDARVRKDYRCLVDLIPYARLLGMDFHEEDGGGLLFRLQFHPQNIGNQRLPALHGGVIGAFMEHAALLHLLWTMEMAVIPKVIDFSIDYLRPGRPEVVYARCNVIRQGQRVANVAVTAWQGLPEKSIATARIHFLLSKPKAECDAVG